MYIWFPASWAPSVVEAIIKRNEKWLAQTPFQHDSVFTAAEVDPHYTGSIPCIGGSNDS